MHREAFLHSRPQRVGVSYCLQHELGVVWSTAFLDEGNGSVYRFFSVPFPRARLVEALPQVDGLMYLSVGHETKCDFWWTGLRVCCGLVACVVWSVNGVNIPPLATLPAWI